MLSSLYKAICKGENFLAITALISSVCLIFLTAMMRTLKYPINWGTDIALLLFAWSVFFSADIAYRNNKTVFVDILVNRLPARMAKALKLINYIIILTFMVAMVYLGILLCIRSWARTFQGIPGFSFSWVTMSVPTGFTLLIITTVRKIYFEHIRNTQAPVPDADTTEMGE